MSVKLLIASLALLVTAAPAVPSHKQALDNRIRALTRKFERMQRKAEKRIPPDVLHKAQGIILLDRVKAGFLFAFQGGGGLAMVKDPKSDQWGPAAFVSANEASLGFQIGGQHSFIVLLFMSADAARVLSQPAFEFGGEARGTGGDASAGVDSIVTSRELAMLVYDEREGLYAGAAIKAGALSPDSDANFAYYRQALTVGDILFGKHVQRSEAASELALKLDRLEGMPAEAARRPMPKESSGPATGNVLS